MTIRNWWNKCIIRLGLVYFIILFSTVFIHFITHVIYRNSKNIVFSSELYIFFLCHETKTNEWHKSNKLTQTNQMQRKNPLAFAFSFPLKSISVFCLVFTVLFVSFVHNEKKIQFNLFNVNVWKSLAVCFVMKLLKYHSMFMLCRATMAFYFFPTPVRTAIFSMTLWHRKLQAVTERCEKYSVRIPKWKYPRWNSFTDNFIHCK